MDFKEYLTQGLEYIILYLSKMDFMKTVSLYGINDYSIYLASGKKKELFGCKLETSSNRYHSIPSISSIANNIRHAQGRSQLFLYYVKNGNTQGIYVYSYNDEAIEQICRDFRVPIMSGDEVVKSLFKIFLIGDHYKTTDNRIVYEYDIGQDEKFFVPWSLELNSGRFRQMTQLGFDNMLDEGTLYQATSYVESDIFTPQELFSLDWEGVLGFTFDYSHVATKARVQTYESVARLGDKQFYDIVSQINSREGDNRQIQDMIENETCLVNTVLYIKNNYETTVSKIGLLLGAKFTKNYLTGPSVFGKTLMNARDYDFDALLPSEQTKQFFATSHKRQVPKNIFPMCIGKDINGNIINYSFEENKSPHAMFIGSTGAGKSTQVIIMLMQMMGYDINTGKALRFDQFNIRYTDVGYSAGNFASSLKKAYPDKVKIYSSMVKNMRFSLFNIKVKNGMIDEDELDYMVGIINFALSVQDGGVSDKDKIGMMTGVEQNFLKTIVRDLLKNKSHSDLYLSEFTKEPGVYDELLKELHALGFSSELDNANLVSELPEKYNYLKKPILADVINLSITYSGKPQYSAVEQEDIKQLTRKLRSLENLTFLSGHSNLSQVRENFSHLDLDRVKKDPVSFSIIYWMLAKEWIDIAKSEAEERLAKRLPTKKTIFPVDEAHIFFSFGSTAFENLFISAVKEMRKFGGIFVFMSQELDDVPEKVVTQLGTKVFIVSPEEKASLKNIVERSFGEMKEADEKVLEAIGDYMMFVKYEKGSIGLKFDIAPEDEWFYKPYHPDFEDHQ